MECFKLDIFYLNYNQFFKEVTLNNTNIYYSLINQYVKFYLTLKYFYLEKEKKLLPLYFIILIKYYFYLVFIFS